MLCMFSFILFVFSLILFIFSHLICILSPYLYSVIIYIFRDLTYVQSHLICIQSHVMNIQSHFICIQSNHICIQSYLYIFSQLFSEAATRERDSNTGVFLWILRNFWNIYSEEHGWVAASVFCILLSLTYRARVHRFEETLPCQLLCEGNDNNKSPLSNIMATCYI